MKFVKIEDGRLVILNLEELQKILPREKIYIEPIQLPHEDLLSQSNIFPLITTPAPSGPGLIVTEGMPEFDGNRWYQTWKTEIDPDYILGIEESAQKGKFFASKEIEVVRLNLCFSCEHLFKPFKVCKICKCVVIGKAKVNSASCPIHKW